MRQTKVNKWFFILVLLVIFSCSKENDLGDSTKVSQENFVELSRAKEIGSEISFKSNASNSHTGKSTIKKRIEAVDEVKNDIGNTVFYVINYIEGGYVILSADNRAQPIIAFSEDDKFAVDKGKDVLYPDGLKSWVANAKGQITAIQKSMIKQTEKERLIWSQVSEVLVSRNLLQQAPSDKCYNRVTTDTKGPFLAVFWDQQKGFNSAMPYINCDGVSKRAFAGCVPIAMAQIMKYYEYPTNYNWSFMDYNTSTDAAAQFIWDVNKAITNVYPGQPSYSCSGTGVTNSCNMGKVLKEKFGYSSADWADYSYQVVKSNLAEDRPVILSGSSDSGGHMWVCDGYKATKYEFNNCTSNTTLYFHMNWGWGGYSDGFFAYNDFNMSDTNENVTNTSYNKNVKMIYNIKP
ncbi:C10 family peptidase [uncultured Flavobacterium sp.]|uniref:C10 family peptidase n=1 Tax=uncultured Flavobacterium sp. TaxID=165435 RepID=UPI00292EA31C|nr:C10 family peptidase [uncultured Flavobacterium sp.]